LHLIINNKGEILDFMFTQGIVIGREPLNKNNFHKRVFGNFLETKEILEKLYLNNLLIDG
jgi:hypothetical protein